MMPAVVDVMLVVVDVMPAVVDAMLTVVDVMPVSVTARRCACYVPSWLVRSDESVKFVAVFCAPVKCFSVSVGYFFGLVR